MFVVRATRIYNQRADYMQCESHTQNELLNDNCAHAIEAHHTPPPTKYSVVVTK